jgi:glycosidase
MISVSFFGCTAKTSLINNKISPTQSADNISKAPSPTESQAAVTITPQPVAYEYEQDLNIIDDHYRNYYEIYVRSFCDSDGDGIGDLKGIISKLDYIKDMGFNGIWLMPIMTSPSYHKYDTSDFYNVDPQYGTLADFKKLLEECHKRGIQLIIDYVFNHSSNQHPWFTQAVNYLEGLKDSEEPDLKVCPYVGYYHFIKDAEGKRGYQKAGKSNYSYECVFYYTQPDLALENKTVRTELEKITKFWLDMGVDGFRLDAAKEYFSGETSRNVEVLKWFNDYVKSVNPNAYIVGEVFDEAPIITSYYASGVTSFFNFPLSQYDGIIASTVKKLGSSSMKSFVNALVQLNQKYSGENPNYIDAPFISNHDTTRVSAQYANNENQMKMAAGLLLTLNGSPFVYYGEEIGMNSQGDKDEDKRLPMQWSKTDAAGMTEAPPGADEVEQIFAPLDEQLQNPLSIANYYKRALRIRNENPEIARGELTPIEELTDNNICAVKKTDSGSEIVIVYNISKEAAMVTLKNAGLEKFKIRGYLTVDGNAVSLKDGILNMPLYSIVILK